jgi:hypothetical protein
MKILGTSVSWIDKILLWKLWRNFPGSKTYWERRYSRGGNSGSGSYGKLAEFKAEVLNNFVAEHAVQSVIEFGCGDGNQLTLANYPKYIGLDVAPKAIQLCRDRFALDASKSFFLYAQDCFVDKAGIFRCDASLSLDVLFHLVEDTVFETYLLHLFQSASQYVIIYSSDQSLPAVGPQERHRKFTDHVAARFPNWRLMLTVSNPYPLSRFAAPLGSLADFYIYEKAQ